MSESSTRRLRQSVSRGRIDFWLGRVCGWGTLSGDASACQGDADKFVTPYFRDAVCNGDDEQSGALAAAAGADPKSTLHAACSAPQLRALEEALRSIRLLLQRGEIVGEAQRNKDSSVDHVELAYRNPPGPAEFYVLADEGGSSSQSAERCLRPFCVDPRPTHERRRLYEQI